ncbi:MAG: DUF5060 domain-containing protein, partial [Lacibacter sp.]|nr:DUF5060 domain-containing protein [Lacibacter sp.]
MMEQKKRINSIRSVILLVIIFFQFNFLPVYSQVTITAPNPNNAKKWDIYELSFASNDNIYANPFWDVDVSGTFTGPNSESLYVEGFYFEKDTWKLRFSPISVGVWNYNI